MNDYMCACGKGFSQKQNLSRHGKKCDVYKDRKLNNLPLNIPPSERTKFTIDSFVDKNGTTVINNNDNRIFNNGNTINNDNSTTNNDNRVTNNTYNIYVDYLNPISCYDVSHIDPVEAYNIYREKCDSMGVGCLLEKLFENDTNKNIKSHDKDNYLAYCCNMLTEIDTPPKFRETSKDEIYIAIVKRLLDRILYDQLDENLHIPRDAQYVGRIMKEENDNSDTCRKISCIKQLDKIAENLSKITIMKKHKFLHESRYYDTDTLSD